MTQQQQHPQQQPAAAQTANLQAQWAEYYRTLEMSYYNQQGGQQQNPAGGETGAPGGGGGEPGKVRVAFMLHPTCIDVQVKIVAQVVV